LQSAQQAIDLGQKLGEVELARAGFAGGFKIGVTPIPFFVGELSVVFAGLVSRAVMLVVGQEPGQVSEARLGAGGPASTAVAVGAHHRAGGQHGVTKLVDVGFLERLESPGRVGVLVDLVGVHHGHTGGRDPRIGPDGGE
jgi:hypothetical protein